MYRYVALALLSCAGCATTNSNAGPASTFKDQFPTREALDKIAAAPPPTKLSRGDSLPTERWELGGPLPEVLEPLLYSDGSPWQQALESAAAQRPGLVTLPASMQCVARENGRFFLAKQVLPDERLGAFIAARCGAFAGDINVSYMSGRAGAEASLERLFEQVRPRLEQQLKQQLDGGARQAGIWLGRESDRVVLIVSVASARARIERTAIVPAADGTVTVAGELLEAGDRVEAVINRGHFGFARCTADETVRLPRFVVSCPADRSDTTAWLEIAGFPAGRIIGHVVVRLLVWPSGAPVSTYAQAEYVHHSLPAGNDPRGQLLQLINEVRTEAGLAPVTLAARESTIAEQVAPHYFAAIAGSEPELVADQIVLGLRAGWEVEGDLRSGDFTYGLIEKSTDLGRLVDTVLERPTGRETLLARNAAQVAIGPVIAPDQQLVAMVASSYQFMGEPNHVADAQRVLGRLTKARLSAHMPAPTIAHQMDPAARDAVARVVRGVSQPTAALHRMIEHAADQLPGVIVRGWVLEISSIDDLTFPTDMLQVPLLGVGVAVGHYRPKGAPWSRLIIFVLAASGMPGLSAAREAQPPAPCLRKSSSTAATPERATPSAVTSAPAASSRATTGT